MLIIKAIETVSELDSVLDLCYRVLGDDNPELYGRDAWHKRFADGLQPMVCAQSNEKIISAVLGRRESAESLVIGFVACDENFRGQGITKKLMAYFEELATKMGYKYITLGSKEDVSTRSAATSAFSRFTGRAFIRKFYNVACD